MECDITKLNIDCIVNAATENLEGGGGIDGSIHRAAGPDLLDACKKFPIINKRKNIRCETGECKLTSGFNLPAKYIMHTVGPRPRDPNSYSKLKSCYESCLREVLRNNIKTIAFCCIATGIFGFNQKVAAKIALSTTREWLEVNYEIVDRVIFCFYDSPNSKKVISDYDIYKELMPIYFPRDESNIENTDDVICVDDNSPIVSHDRNNKISDDSNAQSDNVISPEMMNKQALLKELQNQKQKISIADDKKKENDLKRMNHDNLKSISTTPVKRKRKYTKVSEKKRMAETRENIDDDTKKNIQQKNTKYQQTKRSNYDDDTKKNIQDKDTKQHQTKRSNYDEGTW